MLGQGPIIVCAAMVFQCRVGNLPVFVGEFHPFSSHGRGLQVIHRPIAHVAMNFALGKHGKWLWVKTLYPGEHQNRWQMDVHPPKNGAIAYAPWPNENRCQKDLEFKHLKDLTPGDRASVRVCLSK